MARRVVASLAAEPCKCVSPIVLKFTRIRIEFCSDLEMPEELPPERRSLRVPKPDCFEFSTHRLLLNRLFERTGINAEAYQPDGGAIANNWFLVETKSTPLATIGVL